MARKAKVNGSNIDRNEVVDGHRLRLKMFDKDWCILVTRNGHMSLSVARLADLLTTWIAWDVNGFPDAELAPGARCSQVTELTISLNPFHPKES